jgi:flagellin
MRINNNVAAFNAYRNLSANTNSVSKSLEKLSSGLRINRAGDDAAGLVISQKLRAQVGGLTQATRNAQDGISVAQTAEGALNEVHNMLGRMRDLAVQAANTGANDQQSRDAANKEVTSLKSEVDRISQTTSFGSSDIKLLDGSYGVQNGQAGTVAAFTTKTVVAGTADTFSLTSINGTALGTAITVTVAAGVYTKPEDLVAAINTGLSTALKAGGLDSDLIRASASTTPGGTGISLNGKTSFTTAAGGGVLAAVAAITVGASTASGSGGVFQVGANGGGAAAGDQIALSVGNMNTTGLNIASISLDTGANAKNAINSIDEAIKTVSSARGDLGATQNRFESVISNLQVTTENLTASESRIRDTDYSSEMVKFTKGQILNQAATAMLGQANRLPQGVLSLLQG